jgi:hypothetical protein
MRERQQIGFTLLPSVALIATPQLEFRDAPRGPSLASTLEPDDVRHQVSRGKADILGIVLVIDGPSS